MWIRNCVILISGIFFANADHWGYPVELPNGVIKGEENWGGQCHQGRRQSPVDLAEEASVLGRYSSLIFTNYDEQIMNGKVRNTGHSIQIDILSGQKYLMSGGGLPGTYIMDQMHFHWASEHKINNERYGLELHIVSHEQSYKNFSHAVQNKNGVAVLGVLFHVSDQYNKILKNILDSAEPVKNEAGTASLIKSPFSPVEIIPKNQNSYYRYEGSLTTPTCDEAVIWTVLTDSIPFAMPQIERFKEIKDDVGELLTHNFRQLQRLNSRPLVYVKDLDNDDSSATLASISLGVVIFCKVTYMFIALR